MRWSAPQAGCARRLRALPLALLLGAFGALHRVAFVPAPVRGEHTTSVLPKDGEAAALSAAVLLGLSAAGDPALASTGADSPLAHGAEGVMDASTLEAVFEKAAFFGLAFSTMAAWWKGTLGNARAGEQQLGGRPLHDWGIGFSCLSLVGLLSTRWYDCGHFPLSNMYESLMFLAWGVTAVTLYFAVSEGNGGIGAGATAERRESQSMTSDIAAVWCSPVAWGIVAFATLSLPKELQKASALVPALQSNWLVMHVSVVMLSYATLMFGSVLCMAVIALSQPKDSPITALREAAIPAFRSIAGGLSPVQQPAVATSPQVPDMAMSAMTNTLDFEAGNTATGSAPRAPVQQFQVTGGSGGAVTVEFSSAASAPAARLTEDDKLALTLDDLAYRSLLLGFGFLTIGIVSGAVWANEAWGSYWSWDPKETWALITWLVYAGYLHVRLQLGWDTRDSAKIGAFGFFVVWLCYVGVNLMGIGLHSYGFFLK